MVLIKWFCTTLTIEIHNGCSSDNIQYQRQPTKESKECGGEAPNESGSCLTVWLTVKAEELDNLPVQQRRARDTHFCIVF